MCDYSLQNVKTRPAKVGDKLVTHRFNYSTSGFSAPEDIHVAVCVLPGTELSFTNEVKVGSKAPQRAAKSKTSIPASPWASTQFQAKSTRPSTGKNSHEG
jgi:hypothetical protein